MANVLTISEVNAARVGEREKLIRYKATFSGSYATSGRGADTGDVLKLETATNPNFLSNASWGPNGPSRVYFINGPAGYGAEILPGGTPTHFVMKLYSAGGTELANATAYPAGMTGDLDIVIEASGRSFD